MAEIMIPRKRKKRSLLWDFFTEINEKCAQCNVCGVNVNTGGQTNNMLSHIRNSHSSINKINENPLFNEAESLQLLSTWIIQSGIPLSVYDDANFNKFIQSLNSKIRIPSRRSFTANTLPKMYSNAIGNLKKLLNETSSVGLSIDTWTSVSLDNYISITVHFVDKNTIFHSYLLHLGSFSESHTSFNLSKKISNVIDQWELRNKIISIVHDNARNIVHAIESDFSCSVKCLAHSLQLCIVHALKNKDLQILIKKCRNVICYFKHSTSATASFFKNQSRLNLPQRTLIQDVQTRWNSTFYMIERFLEQKSAIFSVLIEKKNFDLMNQFSNDEFLILERMLKILKPFEEGTKSISGESYPTGSLILPMLKQLENIFDSKIHETSELLSEFITTIKNELIMLRGRYVNCEELLGSCSFLDNRFKSLKFLESDVAETIRSKIQLELNIANRHKIKPVIKSDDSTLWFDYNEYEVSDDDEIKKYISAPISGIFDNPIKFWYNNKTIFPKLYDIAMKYLCIPGSSVTSERVFSKSSFIVNDLRNRLTTKNVEMLVFLNFNAKLMNV